LQGIYIRFQYQRATDEANSVHQNAQDRRYGRDRCGGNVNLSALAVAWAYVDHG
jgi:hypothetical protein